jgi:hypothetical protein
MRVECEGTRLVAEGFTIDEVVDTGLLAEDFSQTPASSQWNVLPVGKAYGALDGIDGRSLP